MKRLKERKAEVILEKYGEDAQGLEQASQRGGGAAIPGDTLRPQPRSRPAGAGAGASSAHRSQRLQRAASGQGRCSDPGHCTCTRHDSRGKLHLARRVLSAGVEKAALQGYSAAPTASRFCATRNKQQQLLERSKGNIPESILSSCLIRGCHIEKTLIIPTLPTFALHSF